MLDVNGFVAPKYVAKVLDELDHDLVACILVLHCFKTWSHTAKHRGTDEMSAQHFIFWLTSDQQKMTQR